MPLNDLTPQLRTRLGRVERVVGIFVVFATLVLLGGFGYYIWHTAKQKGWMLVKVPYVTFVDSSIGLKEGDPVKMMGRNVGQITSVELQPPDNFFNVCVKFVVNEPYYGYIWNDSKVRISGGGFLGDRLLEITKGGKSGETTNLFPTYSEQVTGRKRVVTGIWKQPRDGGGRPFFKEGGEYQPWKMGDDGYWLEMDEGLPLSERMEAIVKQAEDALPNILALTNQLQLVLSNSVALTANLNTFATKIQPTAANLEIITANLRDPKGSFGEWLIPTNTHAKLDETLATANVTLSSANRTIQATETNLDVIVSNLNLTLLNLANITSNLNLQVQENTNLVSGVNRAIVQADTLMQGLKKHWLLRSAFKESKTNSTPTKLLPPDVKSGKRP